VDQVSAEKAEVVEAESAAEKLPSEESKAEPEAVSESAAAAAASTEPEPTKAPQTAAEIMAAAAKTAEDRSAPVCSSRMLLARSLVARQEKLYDRLSDIRRQFGEIDAEVMSLRNARYAHYAHYEERHRQQQAHLARSRLITGR